MKFIGLSTVGLVALISPPRNVQSSTIRGRRILMRNNPDVPTDKNNRGLVEFKDYGSNPVSRYPLGLCEGDCDNDSHCAGNLICWQRDPGMIIPGCEGGRENDSRSDYCIDPNSLISESENPSVSPSMSPTITPSSNPSAIPSISPSDNPSASPSQSPIQLEESAMPSAAIEGDPRSSLPTIWKDTDAPVSPGSSIEPSTSPSSKPSYSPSASPSAAPSSFPSASLSNLPTAPTSQPTEELDLVDFGSDPVSRYPLGLCEGDCDRDSQCAGNLICYQRDRNEAVPGCKGGLDNGSRSDYCIDPNNLISDSGEPSLPPSRTPSALPSDRPSRRPSASPSSSPSSSPSTGPSSSPTHSPSMYSEPPSISIAPSSLPSESMNPSAIPSLAPSVSAIPSLKPSDEPSGSVVPSNSPSAAPSESMVPSVRPSDVPSLTVQPSSMPSTTPTDLPSTSPSDAPSSSMVPSASPSSTPTDSQVPSSHPSSTPSAHPSISPSFNPSGLPSNSPTRTLEELTLFDSNDLPLLGNCEGDCDSDDDCEEGLYCFQRTEKHQSVPGCKGEEFDISFSDYCIFLPPTPSPSESPSESPTASPSISVEPSDFPSFSPSESMVPSQSPSDVPTGSMVPSVSPSAMPTGSLVPSESPSNMPSKSTVPSATPSSAPTNSQAPSDSPSASPSLSMVPSTIPSTSPSESTAPSNVPSTLPSMPPSKSMVPSMAPSYPPSLPIGDIFRLITHSGGPEMCLDCENGCIQEDALISVPCSENVSYFEFLVGSAGRMKISVSGTGLCFERQESISQHILLKTCSESEMQLWNDVAGVATFDDPFRISLESDGLEYCLSHPDVDDQLRQELCSTSIFHDRSLWKKY